MQHHEEVKTEKLWSRKPGGRKVRGISALFSQRFFYRLKHRRDLQLRSGSQES
jgi:hypothetical protein